MKGQKKPLFKKYEKINGFLLIKTGPNRNCIFVRKQNKETKIQSGLFLLNKFLKKQKKYILFNLLNNF